MGCCLLSEAWQSTAIIEDVGHLVVQDTVRPVGNFPCLSEPDGRCVCLC